VPFADSDHVIEQQLGCSIREYFEREGEDRFRDIEAAVLDDLTRHHEGVLATGGGAVLRDENRSHLRGRGHVVYLRSTPEEVFRRLRHDANRPLLQVNDPLGRLRDLFAVRDPLYRATAHFVIETGRPSRPWHPTPPSSTSRSPSETAATASASVPDCSTTR
jgi:shikimate kinase